MITYYHKFNNSCYKEIRAFISVTCMLVFTFLITDKYNTYVKVVYLSCGQKIQSKRSAVVSNNRNPTYNATFTFKLSSNILYESFIVVSVMMKELLRKDVPIGRLVLGPFQYTEGRERTPWGRALLSQEKVTHWFKMYLWYKPIFGFGNVKFT